MGRPTCNLIVPQTLARERAVRHNYEETDRSLGTGLCIVLDGIVKYAHKSI